MTTSVAPAALPRPDLRALPREQWIDAMTEHFRGGLPGLLGIEILHLEPGRIVARLPLRNGLMMAAGDFVHAGTVVALADSAAGWGALASLPDGIEGFTTAELKVNLVATARMPDVLTVDARLLHGGRTTQVWDATVSRGRDRRVIAHFRCTQYLLEEQRR
jgi:uncharacterized protein (TIGR00369 family)